MQVYFWCAHHFSVSRDSGDRPGAGGSKLNSHGKSFNPRNMRDCRPTDPTLSSQLFLPLLNAHRNLLSPARRPDATNLSEYRLLRAFSDMLRFVLVSHQTKVS